MRADPDRRRRGRAARASSSSRPDQHDLLLAVGDPGEPGAEAGVQHRDADRAGDVRLVELEVRADVDEQRARARASARPGAARAACTSTPAVSSGPRLMSTIAWKFGGWGGSSAVARSTKRSSSSSAKQLVVPALVADRRGDLHVHAGPAAERAAEVPGPDLACRAARAASRAGERKMPRAPSSLSTARSGRATSPTNSVSPVSTAHGSSPRARVDQREGRVLGPVARRVDRAHAHRAQLQLPAVVERLVVVVRLRVAVDVDRRAGRGREPAVAGDVVGVVVRLEDVLDRHAHVARERAGTRRSRAGVDDRRDAGVARRRSGRRRSRGRRG